MGKIYLICLILLLSSTWAWGFGGLFLSICLSLLLLKYFASLENRISRLENKLQITSAQEIKSVEVNKSQQIFQEPQQTSSLNATQPIKIKQEIITDTKINKETNNAAQFIFSYFKSYILTGNPIANIGVVILFIGVAFLFKYASNYIHFSIELRLLGVSAAGIVALITGWRLHANRPIYANILEGCGIGLLFLTTYAAFKLYEVLPPLPAFSLLLAIVILSGALSVWQNTKSLAILGILGGFLSPILISTGEGNFVLLFSYYAVLNVSILGIAWFKAWSELNLIGFIFTFIVSALWGWQAYEPNYFYLTESFLILFFLFYVVIAILYSLPKSKISSHYIDAVITFGTPFITYALQIGLVKNMNHGLAWSAFALCLFYAVVATLINFFRYPPLRILTEAFFALALLFGTMAIPLATTDNWSVIAWALEGLAIMYIGIREKRMRLRLAAAILQIGSGILFFMHANMNDLYTLRPYFDNFHLTAAAIGLSGLVCASLWHKHAKECALFENDFAQIIFIWGSLWWYVNGIHTICLHENSNYIMMGCTLFFASSSFAFWTLDEIFEWRWLRYLALTLLPVMVLFELTTIGNNLAYSNNSLATWVISFLVLYGMLYRHEKWPAFYLPRMHLISLLLLTCVIADETSRAILFYTNWPDTWCYITWGAVLSSILFLITNSKSALIWPVNNNKNLYQSIGGGILTVAIMLWVITSYSLSGDVSPLPYLPLLNPLDVIVGFALFISISNRSTLLNVMAELTIKILFSLLIFIWLNTILMRTLHHWLDIPYDALALWNSTTVQTSLSIFWTLSALIATFVAARNHSRALWFGGFSLILIVVVKLFFVDLSSIGTLQRIITFITVGILLLINGYISPVPPKK